MATCLTPRFYDSNAPFASPRTTDRQRYVPLALSPDKVWNTAFVGKEAAWNTSISIVKPTTTEPPAWVSFSDDWQDDDDVSVLNDDPDQDDQQILPQTTYDVLAPLFDDLFYRDDSEVEEDDVPADGARAA